MKRLDSEELYTKTSLNDIGYNSTSDVASTKYEVVGQSRALKAIEFGVGMRRDNYNLYLVGSKGLGKHEVIHRVLEQHAAQEKAPSDWCYVDNFEEFYKPKVLELPAGMGEQLRTDMAQLVEDLSMAVPAAYENDEYRTQINEIEKQANEQKEKAFSELSERADKQGITMINTPTGYTIVPVKDGKPMPQDDFQKLDEKEQAEIQKKIDKIQEELRALILQIPIWEKETREKFKDLNSNFAKGAAKPFLKTLQDKYAEVEQIKQHLEVVSKDIVKNIHLFLPIQNSAESFGGKSFNPSPELRRYEVNVLVNNKLTGTPIVYENNPTYNNLLGRIEHIAQEGALITDFTLIKPGALHRANGGYLILDMHNLLMNPFAWEGLKRTLFARQIRIETLERQLSIVSTVSLEPEVIPLNVKVILIGDRNLYYLLKTYDPEFNELFKATADFSESFQRDALSVASLAQTIANIVLVEKIRPIQQSGVARIIEQCSRDAGDAEKLSLHKGRLKDLILESDYWAGKSGSNQIENVHVQNAIDARIYRADQLQELTKENILRGTVLIDTAGEAIGQINGLSVYQLGDFSFGQPSRITATARLGKGNVLDIEREIKLGGPIHSKGVMILSSCLANRYAKNRPFSLSATLVFEQNYGGVDGDSASIAEFCALISALINIPIKQNLAVTGSINQHGCAQAIGGVNQKIEGFFEICKARNLSGDEGVIIPQSNVKHLMLKNEVVEAVKNKKFNIFAVETVDEALELLLGMSVGEPDTEGNFPEDSINARVTKRLDELLELQKEFSFKNTEPTENEDH